MLFIENLIYYFSYLIFPFTIYLLWQYNNINKFIFLIGIIFCFGFIYSRFVEPNILVKKIYKINLRTKEKIKIAVFSDLHFGVFVKKGILKRIVKRINESNVDLVMIPGDFAYNISKKQLNNYFKELKNINVPAFAVTGNHDNGMTGNNVAKELTSVLKKYNIKVIDDKTEKITLKNQKISIIGIGDYWTKKANYKLLEKTFQDNLKLVMTHNPDSVYHFPNSKSDLVITGHTHGGQIKIPFLYKLFLPSEYKYESGFYEANGMKVFVTSGIGSTGIPFRFLVPPELDIIEVN